MKNLLLRTFHSCPLVDLTAVVSNSQTGTFLILARGVSPVVSQFDTPLPGLFFFFCFLFFFLVCPPHSSPSFPVQLVAARAPSEKIVWPPSFEFIPVTRSRLISPFSSRTSARRTVFVPPSIPTFKLSFFAPLFLHSSVRVVKVSLLPYLYGPSQAFLAWSLRN